MYYIIYTKDTLGWWSVKISVTYPVEPGTLFWFLLFSVHFCLHKKNSEEVCGPCGNKMYKFKLIQFFTWINDYSN